MSCITERNEAGEIVRLENHVWLDKTVCVECGLPWPEAEPLFNACQVLCEVDLETGRVTFP